MTTTRALIGWILSLGLAAAAGVFVYQTSVEGSADLTTTADESPVTYTAFEGELGETVALPIRAEVAAVPIGHARSSGTVTSLSGQYNSLTVPEAGDVLLTIDERPLIIVPGSIPSYRRFVFGNEGQDVRQLQSYLASTGFLESKVDGKFGSASVQALNHWYSDSTGLKPPVGGLGPADILFVPEGQPLVLNNEITVGALVSEGTVLVVSSDVPRFWIAAEDRPLVTRSMPLVITGHGEERPWIIETGTLQGESDSEHGYLLGLGEVCKADCGVLPIGRSVLDGTLIVVPEATGVIVPVAAIGTVADGSSVVNTPEGLIPIQVRATQAGLALVEGIASGDTLLLPSD